MNGSCQLYRHFGDCEELLYIGISLSTANRLAQHKNQSGWFHLIKNVTIENFSTRELAIAAEKKAIIEEHPKYNKVHNKRSDIEIARLVIAKAVAEGIKGAFTELGLYTKHSQ